MWLGRDGCASPARGLVTHKGAGGMGLSHGTPQSGRFYPGLEAERKADSLLTHAPGPPGPWPDRALLSSLGRVGPGLTLPGEACPIPRLGACNEKWVSREARRGAQSQAWRPRQQRGQGPSLSRHPLKYYTLPLPHSGPTRSSLRIHEPCISLLPTPHSPHPHTTPKTSPEGEEGGVDSSRCPWC